MKLPTLLVMVCLASSATLFADDRDLGVMTYNGKSFPACRLDSITGEGARISSPNGDFVIPLDKLPFSIRGRFKSDYDAAIRERSGSKPTSTQPTEPRLTQAQWQAQALAKFPQLAVSDSAFNKHFLEVVAAQRTANPALFKDPRWPMTLAEQTARDLETPEERKARETDELMEKVRFHMDGKIRQMAEEGAIVDASVDDKTGQGMLPLPEPVFVFGLGRTHVDGDPFTATVWAAGTYRYTTVSGAAKTLRSYSTNKEDALRRIRSLNDK